MALIGVLCAGAVSLIFVKLMDLKLGYALGLFAGSGTSTPTLQAAIATLGNDDPAVGYSVSYPFGVAGPILFLYIAYMVLKPKIEAPTSSGHRDARNRRAQSGSLRQDARRADGRAARRRADRRPAPREPQRAGVAQFRHRRKRRRPRRRAHEGSARASRQAPRRSRARPFRQRPQRPRLPSRLRLPPGAVRQNPRRTRPAGRESVRRHPGPPRRRRHPAAPRPRARVRRPRRRARPSRRFRGDAQILRRLDQDHRRVQLHLHRHRHGARLPDRRDPDSAARHRQNLGRLVRRADHGARSSANCAAPAA